MFDITFIKKFEKTVKKHWNEPAVKDYQQEGVTYGELAAEIETNHILWCAAGLKKGDKISINAKSCAGWAKTFMSIVSGGYAGDLPVFLCQLRALRTGADEGHIAL